MPPVSVVAGEFIPEGWLSFFDACIFSAALIHGDEWPGWLTEEELVALGGRPRNSLRTLASTTVAPNMVRCHPTVSPRSLLTWVEGSRAARTSRPWCFVLSRWRGAGSDPADWAFKRSKCRYLATSPRTIFEFMHLNY